MKLYYSINSPYARKCRVLVLEKGLQDRVEFTDRMPLDEPIPDDLLAANPLARVPALELDDGSAMTESNVICAYLDSLGEPRLIPTDERARIAMLRFVALTDGILDAAVHCVMEGRRPEEKRWPAWVKRKEDSIVRTLAALEQQIIPAQPVTMATIALGVTLAYVEFRLGHLEWRKHQPFLAAWADSYNNRPTMLQTQPRK
ncbi:MAG: glutathione S-transferase family protein [Alphaproteobacteria bacterium]